VNPAIRKRLEELVGWKPVRALLDTLSADGEEARIVGGAVRNCLLSETVSDIDIATTCLPEETTRRAEARGWKAVPTGIAHGTITVVIDGEPFETTTLRADRMTDGRRAEVTFGRDFAEDAARRDFTINALSLDRHGTVHDYGGGLEDIAARRVRFFGDPDRRIREDYLRILRFYRFSARYAAPPFDEPGRRASAALKDGLAILSAERIGAELMKLLDPATPHAIAAIEAMEADGVLAAILGERASTRDLQALDKAERAYDGRPDALRRLMALALHEPADIDFLTDRLRLSKKARARLATFLGANDLGPQQTHIDPAIYRLGNECVTDLALLRVARGDWTGTAYRLFVEKALRRAEAWHAPEFPIRAKDMQARGLEPGPAMGEALRHAETLWLERGLPMRQEQLDAIADDALRASA
jgi:poly(A) polymerase